MEETFDTLEGLMEDLKNSIHNGLNEGKIPSIKIGVWRYQIEIKNGKYILTTWWYGKVFILYPFLLYGIHTHIGNNGWGPLLVAETF